MAFQRIDGGVAAGVNLNVMTPIVTLQPPAAGSVRYLLVARFNTLGATHTLTMRSVRGGNTLDEPQDANNETTDELDWIETTNDGDPQVTLSVVDTAGVSPAAGYEWDLYSEAVGAGAALVVPTVVGAAVGYYADRSLVVITAGEENFNADFSLDADGGVANEGVVQLCLDNADSLVDEIALEEGVTFAGTPPHAIATNDQPLFRALQRWASRWARADGHQLRGEMGGQGDDGFDELATTSPKSGGGSEGLFRYMKSEAEKRIRKLLQAKVAGSSVGFNTGQDGIGVSAICPARAPMSTPFDNIDVWG